MRTSWSRLCAALSSLLTLVLIRLIVATAIVFYVMPEVRSLAALLTQLGATLGGE